MLSSTKPFWVSRIASCVNPWAVADASEVSDAVPCNYEGLCVIGELLGHILASGSSLIIDLRRLKGDTVVLSRERIPFAHDFVVLFNEGG